MAQSRKSFCRIELGLIGAGWRIADRSSRYLLVRNSSNWPSLAYEFLLRTDNPVFEFIDRERVVMYR